MGRFVSSRDQVLILLLSAGAIGMSSISVVGSQLGVPTPTPIAASQGQVLGASTPFGETVLSIIGRFLIILLILAFALIFIGLVVWVLYRLWKSWGLGEEKGMAER